MLTLPILWLHSDPGPAEEPVLPASTRAAGRRAWVGAYLGIEWEGAGQGLLGLGQAAFGLAMQSQPEVQWLMPQLPTHKPVAK